LIDLAQILFEDHGVSVSEQTLSRVLRSMGYRKLSARPRHHAQDQDAIPVFKKPFPPAWQRSRRPRAASR
jgi:Winged helix-turn helix